MRWGKLTLPEKSPLTAITKYVNCVDNVLEFTKN